MDSKKNKNTNPPPLLTPTDKENLRNLSSKHYRLAQEIAAAHRATANKKCTYLISQEITLHGVLPPSMKTTIKILPAFRLGHNNDDTAAELVEDIDIRNIDGEQT